MLLKTKDGISCDVCGTIYKDVFNYYSFESSKIAIDSATMRVTQLGKDLDIDVCEKCYVAAEDKVRKNLIKAPVAGTVKCDFCTKLLKGKFDYHRILIHKVEVDKILDKPKVTKNFMDFNADDGCFGQLANLAMETRQNAKTKGEWS